MERDGGGEGARPEVEADQGREPRGSAQRRPPRVAGGAAPLGDAGSGASTGETVATQPRRAAVVYEPVGLTTHARGARLPDGVHREDLLDLDEREAPIQRCSEVVRRAQLAERGVYPLPLTTKDHLAFAMPDAQRAFSAMADGLRDSPPQRAQPGRYLGHVRVRGGQWLWAWSRLIGSVLRAGTPAVALLLACDAAAALRRPPAGDLTALNAPPVLRDMGRWTGLFRVLAWARRRDVTSGGAEADDSEAWLSEDACRQAADDLERAFPNSVRDALRRQLGLTVRRAKCASREAAASCLNTLTTPPPRGPAPAATSSTRRTAGWPWTQGRAAMEATRRRSSAWRRGRPRTSVASRTARAAATQAGAAAHSDHEAASRGARSLTQVRETARSVDRQRSAQPAHGVELEVYAVLVRGAVRVTADGRSGAFRVTLRRERGGSGPDSREACAVRLRGVTMRDTAMRHLAVGLADVTQGVPRGSGRSPVLDACGVPGATMGRNALAVVALGSGMRWDTVLDARLQVVCEGEEEEEGVGAGGAGQSWGTPRSEAAFEAEAVRRVCRALSGGREPPSRYRFVCGQSRAVAEGLFGDDTRWWPGARVLERRVPSRPAIPVEADTPRMMVVRVQGGEFEVSRGRVKVRRGDAVALLDLGALRERAAGDWATQEATEARARMAAAVEEAQIRSEQRGVAVDFGVARAGGVLYLVLGVLGALRPWWRSILWRFPYADAQRDLQRLPGGTLRRLLHRDGVQEQPSIAFERDGAMRELVPNAPREPGAQLATERPDGAARPAHSARRPDAGAEVAIRPQRGQDSVFRVVRAFATAFDAARVGAEHEVTRFVLRRSAREATDVYVPFAVDDPDQWPARVVLRRP